MSTKPQEHYLHRELRAGDAIRYWQLSAIAEQRHDVPDQPMQGEMDPFFFLSKHKNFIPHEYPCRTAFKAAYAGKRPTPSGEAVFTDWWLPFGSDRVDLSGFWFRPTRLGTWARTCIEASAAGSVKLRLTTCGGSILQIGGHEVLWTADYQRNLETSHEIDVTVEAGCNEIVLYFDDLAERDIRYFFQLDYLGGVPIRVAMPIPVCEAAADRVERLLDGVSFERAHYFEGDIRLRFGEPAQEDYRISTTVTGDIVSLDAPLHFEASLPRGAHVARIAVVDEVPADFRNFTIRLETGGFHAQRRIGVEICHLDRQPVPSGVLAERIDEALDYVARFSELSSVKAFARLALGRAGLETDGIIDAVLPSVVDCHDCADFTLVPLLWCRVFHGAQIGAETRERLDQAILRFRYWMDEPGNDVQWYFSENHALLFHTSAYLAGNFFAARKFVRSGRLGADQGAVGRERLVAWFDHFEACEMAEWNSAPYFPIDLKGLTALAAMAPDEDLRSRARAAITRLLEQIARSAHHGLLTASQGRSYEYTLRAGRSLELSGLSRLIWGRGWYGARFHVVPQMAVLMRDHGFTVAPELASQAAYDGAEAIEWRFAQGQNRIARLYHYKTRDVAMGSIAAYRQGEWGYQETVLHLRVGRTPEAQIWINHPGETIQGGFGRPSFWGGCGTLPRVQQYRGLAILRFEPHEGQPDFSHAWVPAAMFDEFRQQGRYAAVRSGQGMAVLIGSRDLAASTEGPSRGCELRLNGVEDNYWIVRLYDRSAPCNLGEFIRHAGALSLSQTDGDVLEVNDPFYGVVRFHADGRVEAENRCLDPAGWSIAGESEVLAIG